MTEKRVEVSLESAEDLMHENFRVKFVPELSLNDRGLTPGCVVEDFCYYGRTGRDCVFALKVGTYILRVEVDYNLATNRELLRGLLRHKKLEAAVDIEIARRVLELNKEGVMPLSVHNALVKSLEEEILMLKELHAEALARIKELEKTFWYGFIV